jgi:hypothetical protein
MYLPSTYPPTTESPTTRHRRRDSFAHGGTHRSAAPCHHRPADRGGGRSWALEFRSCGRHVQGGGGGDRGNKTCPDGNCCSQVSPVPANGPREVPFYAVPSRGLVEPGPHSSRFTPTNDRDYEVRLVRHRPRIPRRKHDAAHEEEKAPEECEETRCETSAGGANPSPGAALKGDGVG